jgi:hypothetical protein
MDPNPYAPPSPAGETLADSRVFAVARHQRRLNRCVLAYLACVAAFKVAPEGPARTAAAFGSVLVMVLAAVFAVMLASRLYSTLTAIVVGVMTLVPCGGIVGAVYLSSQATALLRRNGYTVGLLGADVSQFARRLTPP